MADRIGSVAPGLQADIIGLVGDPLKDITAVRRVAFVMKGGIVYQNAARGTVPADTGLRPQSPPMILVPLRYSPMMAVKRLLRNGSILPGASPASSDVSSRGRLGCQTGCGWKRLAGSLPKAFSVSWFSRPLRRSDVSSISLSSMRKKLCDALQ